MLSCEKRIPTLEASSFYVQPFCLRILLSLAPKALRISSRSIEYRIYLRHKVDQGLEDIRRGRVLEQEEVEQRMTKWLDE